MLTLDINPVIKTRGVEKPYTFLVKAGISPQSSTMIVQGKTRVFRLDHIEKICELLNCTPNDLLSWTPNKNVKLHDNHSLNKLKRDKKALQLQDTLKTLSLEQLNQIATFINQQNSDKE